MSIKSKTIAGAAALSMVIGGVGVATAGAANAATPSCGPTCVTYFTQHQGKGAVLDVYKRVAKVGQKIILWPPSNIDPAQDFVYMAQGTVNHFFRLGLVSAALKLHYGRDQAFELEYAPYGVGTGLCVGVGTTAKNLTQVSLQMCGASSKSLWVEDSADASGGFEPLINGSNNNFSHPFVMTSHAGNQVITYQLGKFSDGTVSDHQMWAPWFGVL